MAIQEDSFLVLVFSDPSEDGWWEGDRLAFELFSSEVDELGSGTDGFELIVQVIGHLDDILAV